MITDAIKKYNNGKYRFFEEIFTKQVYQDALEKDVVIDLGANYGFFSMYVYDRAKQIYAIEAAKDNFDHLVADIAKFDLPKIKPFHLAIGGKRETRHLYDCGGNGGYSITTARGNPIEKVETMSLYDFLEEQKISHVDLLKIDVECAEREIFEAKDFPKAAQRISYIIGEVHAGYDDVLNRLRDLGYTVEDCQHSVFTARK